MVVKEHYGAFEPVLSSSGFAERAGPFHNDYSRLSAERRRRGCRSAVHGESTRYEEVTSPVVLDATVLSNVAQTDSIEWLVSTVDSPYTVPTVGDELARGVDASYGYLKSALDAIEGSDIAIGTIEPVPDDFSILRNHLDPGETEALAVARERGGTLATEDSAARTFASEHGRPVTGSVGLLVSGSSEAHSRSKPPTGGWRPGARIEATTLPSPQCRTPFPSGTNRN